MRRRASTPLVKPAPVEPQRRPRWLRPVIVALAAVLLFAAFSTEAADSDTFWHLKTGEYMWHNHRLPVPDPFSYGTYLGKLAYPGEQHTRYFNLTHEWLAQLYFYAVYAMGGFPAIVAMRAVLLLLVCAAISLIVWRRTSHFYLSLAAALIFMGVLFDAPVSDRPLLLTLVLLVALLLILESRARLWLLPALFAVWGNTHGGFIMGWATVGAYCLEDLYVRWRWKPVPDSRALWFWSFAAILASGLNPNGFRAVEVLLLYRKSALQSQLIEWTPPALWPPMEMFTFVLYGAGALLLWARAKARPADWLLYLLFGLAAARASRNIVFLGIAGALVIACYFPWRRMLPLAAEYAVALALLMGGAWQIARGHSFEFRAAEWRFPAGPATFLQQRHITGRMFNIYGDGGYLMWRLWPGQKVLLDGRALNEAVNLDAVRIINSANATDGKSAFQLLDEYRIEVIVAEGFEYYTGRLWWLPVNLAILPQTEWKLVYRDPSGVVFMRHPPPGVQPLPAGDALLSFEDQCEIHLARDPKWPGCAAGLARLFASLNDLPRARKWGIAYLNRQSHPDPADVRALQQLMLQ